MFPIEAIAVAIGLAFSAGAMAQTMSESQYKSHEDGIAVAYRSAKAVCASLSGNAKDICAVDASGKEKVAKAELESKYKPSGDAGYKVRVAKAEADYALARQKCDDNAGNANNVCVEEAKTAAVAAHGVEIGRLGPSPRARF